MAEFYPILFSAPMVQAILDGRKSQTRRPIDKDDSTLNDHRMICSGFTNSKAIAHFRFIGASTDACGYNPKYNAGDILWVREAFQVDYPFSTFCYKADGVSNILKKWKPSIFMPKAACRIFLEVTDVRVERLQDISQEDSQAEGIFPIPHRSASYGCTNHSDNSISRDCFKCAFKVLWNKINGSKLPWKANPWVWVYSFKQVSKPENFIK